MGVGHERQQHRLADPRLQRAGPAGGPGGRAGLRRRRRLSAASRRVAAAEREPRRPGRLAARLRARRGRRAARGHAPAPRRRPHRLAHRGRRGVRAHRGRVQLRRGHLHPYYVSALAPFTAALAGAGAAQLAGLGRTARVLAPGAVVAGMATELAVVAELPGQLDVIAPWWLARVLAAATLAVADTASLPGGARGRARGAAAGARDLVRADARPRDERHVPRRRPGRARGPARAAAGCSAAPSLDAAAAYAAANGGGTIAVSSQSSAATAVLGSGVDVVALGGFSGRESEVSTAWLAERVASGDIRWVLADGQSEGMPQDGRTGRRGCSRRSRTPARRWRASTGCTTAPARPRRWLPPESSGIRLRDAHPREAGRRGGAGGRARSSRATSRSPTARSPPSGSPAGGRGIAAPGLRRPPGQRLRRGRLHARRPRRLRARGRGDPRRRAPRPTSRRSSPPPEDAARRRVAARCRPGARAAAPA